MVKIPVAPLTPSQHAALHHGLVLLVAKAEARIKELEDAGSGKTEIAEHWRRTLAAACEALAALA